MKKIQLKDTDQLDDLKQFLVQWFGEYKETYGVPVDEIPTYLPKALRELYAFAGRWKWSTGEHFPDAPEIFQQQDCLYGINELILKENRVEFLSENQGCWTCEVDANQEISPVYSNISDIWEEEESGHIPCNPSLYHFLKTFCLQELVFGCEYLVPREEIESLQKHLQLELFPIWSNANYLLQDDEPLQFYLLGDTILVMYLDDEYWIGSNQIDLDAIMENLE